MLAHRFVSLLLRARVALPAFGLGAAVLLAPVPARAVSAADKATARDLAVAGIKLYRAGKYKDALDRLTRAEALFNAPIHLLYIARCQVKLGKVVEGAETYRRLGRVHLTANAPTAFKDAQASGGKELTALVPKIPMLRVEVTPANVSNMDVVIDGEHLPPAIVGVDRPADPGKHTVQVTAPGFQTAKTTVEIKLGEKRPVKLTLKPAPGSSGASGAAAGTTGAGAAAGSSTAKTGAASKAAQKPEKPAETGTKKPSLIGFMAGLRLGGLFSVGNALSRQTPQGLKATKMSTFAGPGFAGEIHAGVRIWQYFTPQVFGSAAVLYPKRVQLYDLKNTLLDTNTKATFQSGGLGVMIGTPRNRFGGFGELDLVFDSVSQRSTLTNVSGCTLVDKLSGTGLRLGGGVVIPIASIFELTPFALATVEKFSTEEFDAMSSKCPRTQPPLAYQTGRSVSQTIQHQNVHGTFFVGLGGDFVFGKDKPAK